MKKYAAWVSYGNGTLVISEIDIDENGKAIESAGDSRFEVFLLDESRYHNTKAEAVAFLIANLTKEIQQRRDALKLLTKLTLDELQTLSDEGEAEHAAKCVRKAGHSSCADVHVSDSK